MPLRCWIAGIGLLCALLLAACETTPPPTVTPAPPTAILVPPTATSVPPAPTAATTPTSLPPTNTPLPPTDTPLPPTATPITLGFDLGLDGARLAALLGQADEHAHAAAADAQLIAVRLDLVAYSPPAAVTFRYYALTSHEIITATAHDGGDIGPLEQRAAPDLPPTLLDPTWQPQANWAPAVAATLAAVRATPDPAHGRWLFTLTQTPGGAGWQAALTATFQHTLAAGQVREDAVRPGQTPGPPVPPPPGEDLPFGFILNNTAVDRYYRAAGRLVDAQVSDGTLREVDLRFGDPADSEPATVLYHFYSAKKKQEYLATFDIGGRRDVTLQPLPPGASKATYKESTLPWKTAPAWAGLMQVAAGPLGAVPAERVRMFLRAVPDHPATWVLTTTLTAGKP